MLNNELYKYYLYSMTIFIAPIGVSVDHVKGWLAEESSGVTILWLIHSKKSPKYDFPKIAKKLVKDLESAYNRIEIKLKIIDSAFEVDPTMDAISQIINEECNEDTDLTNRDFTLNITGGTNIVAAATMISATWHGTKAHYVLEPQKNDPKSKKYVIDLPIKSIGIAKTKGPQLDYLQIIAESKYFIENIPDGIEAKIIKGSITRKNLLEKVEAEAKKKASSEKLKKINSSKKKIRLEYIIGQLENSGYIEKIGYVEYYIDSKKSRLEKNSKIQKKGKSVIVEIKDKEGRVVRHDDWPLQLNRDDRVSRYQVTALGSRAARDSFLFK